MKAASDRFEVSYRLTCAPGESVAERARAIAFEQTVELPSECVAPEIEAAVVGRVEHADERSGEVRISYPTAALGSELPQLLSLVFGNVSMQTGVLVTGVDWPAEWLRAPAGPRYGIEGLRRLCQASENRPLLCVANKPLGLSSAALAKRCGELARAGVDIVKDDHGLANQVWAPFDERVARCQEAVEEARHSHGSETLYFPNLTGSLRDLDVRLDRVAALGCRGVLVSPMVLGLDVVRSIARERDLAILAHPAFAGAYFGREHGIVPELLLGEIFRLAGSDGVIYPNVEGRFALSTADCAAVNQRLRGPLGELLPAFPVPAGGIDIQRVPEWVTAYGPDSMFLIGTSLYRRPDIAAAAGELMDQLRRTPEAVGA